MKKFLKTILITLTLSLGVSSLSHAKEAVGSGANPYVDCGIGAALFPETHWAAVTSNVTWDAGSTAITSATMSPETCSKRTVKAALFIRDTYPNVIEQTASGEGKHLTAMLEILGCSAESHSNIINATRAEVAAHIGSDEYFDMDRLDKSAGYYNIISRTISTQYSSSCSV